MDAPMDPMDQIKQFASSITELDETRLQTLAQKQLAHLVQQGVAFAIIIETLKSHRSLSPGLASLSNFFKCLGTGSSGRLSIFMPAEAMRVQALFEELAHAAPFSAKKESSICVKSKPEPQQPESTANVVNLADRRPN